MPFVFFFLTFFFRFFFVRIVDPIVPCVCYFCHNGQDRELPGEG
jgi:hypothetical protein